MLPTLPEIEEAALRVYEAIQPTPQISWPLLNHRCNCKVWVKHENHNPTGAFKVRGGLIYLGNLKQREAGVTGVCAATRGNHGQSVAFAAARNDLQAVIVVPEGNNPEKNAAVVALGAELVISGRDFDESVERAMELAQKMRLVWIRRSSESSQKMRTATSYPWQQAGSPALTLLTRSPMAWRSEIPTKKHWT